MRIVSSVLLLVAAACGGDERLAHADARDTSAGEVVSRPAAPARRPLPTEELRRAIAARIEAGRPAGASEARWRAVVAMYQRTGGLPLWFDSTGGDGRMPALARAIADAPAHALPVSAARVDSLRAAIVAARDTSAGEVERVASADVRLSEAFAELAADLLSGQVDPRTATRGWYINSRRSEVDSLTVQLATTAPSDSLFALLAPEDPVYDELRLQLAAYRAIAAAGGWGTVPAGPALRAGDRADPARLAAVVRRLRSEGYLSPDSAAVYAVHSAMVDDVYDARLAAAVAHFQAHHAIDVDSALGPGTTKTLNVPAAYRAGQIAANLERIRWLPRAVRERYLLVNVPSFRLLLREGGRTVESMKVVVGAEYEDRFTPVFADSMSFVVFQPYWNVPRSIALEEIIPKAARDPGYLARNDYEVVRGDADAAPVVSPSQLTRANVSAYRVRVRQRPGPSNALGHAKFIFPNEYNIYLHDTPQRTLFERDVRAFSHGCIRVERPAELAQWVLGWDSTRVAQAMSSDRPNQYAPLARKLPVFILYLTAFTRDGELYFGNDLYGRDDALVKRLAAATMPDARTTAATAALRSLVASR